MAVLALGVVGAAIGGSIGGTVLGVSAAIAAIEVLLSAESQDAGREDGPDLIQPLGGSHDFGRDGVG